jgi:hypothetical protein
MLLEAVTKALEGAKSVTGAYIEYLSLRIACPQPYAGTSAVRHRPRLIPTFVLITK